MKSQKKTTLLLLALCIVTVTLFCAGCKKDSGWKAQSAQNTGSSAGAGAETPAKSSRPTSVKVSSFLHDLFGGELPEDTDRYQLPTVEETRHIDFEKTIMDADVYGSTMYYIESEVSAVYTYDLETGESAIFTEDIGRPCNICTDADGVYVSDLRTDEIVWFTFDGVRSGSVPLPEKPHDGEGWGYNFYIADLRHYDGLLLMAARDAVWTIADGETGWQRAEFMLMRGEAISGAVLRSRSRIVVSTHTYVVGSIVHERITEIDRDGSNEHLLLEDSTQDMTANEGRLYMVDASNSRLLDITDGNGLYVQTLNPENDNWIYVAKRVEIANGTVFVLWGRRVTLCPIADSYNTVRLIAPESRRTSLMNALDNVLEIPVQVQFYEDSIFSDKLSASLLAGEGDFDAALVTTEGTDPTTMLRSLLKNRQYVDLYQSEELKEHLNALYPGVKSMMEYRGEMIALPIGFEQRFYGFTQTAQDSGIGLPGANWDLNDFDALMEALKASGEYALLPGKTRQNALLLLSMATSIVQAESNLLRDDVGDSALTALTDFFTELQSYRDDGVLTGKKAFFDVYGAGIFFPYGMNNAWEELSLANPPIAVQERKPAGVVNVPPTSGKNPVVLTGFYFVNPMSERTAQALSLLAALTDEDNRYNVEIYDSPIFPDITLYYRNEDYTYNEETQEYAYSPHREYILGQLDYGYTMAINAFLPDYYATSELCLVDTTDRAYNAVADFLNGKADAGSTAKTLYEEFVYRLKG